MRNVFATTALVAVVACPLASSAKRGSRPRNAPRKAVLRFFACLKAPKACPQKLFATKKARDEWTKASPKIAKITFVKQTIERNVTVPRFKRRYAKMVKRLAAAGYDPLTMDKLGSGKGIVEALKGKVWLAITSFDMRMGARKRKEYLFLVIWKQGGHKIAYFEDSPPKIRRFMRDNRPK